MEYERVFFDTLIYDMMGENPSKPSKINRDGPASPL